MFSIGQAAGAASKGSTGSRAGSFVSRTIAGAMLAAGVFMSSAPVSADPLQQLSWAVGTPNFSVSVQSTAAPLTGNVVTNAGAFSGTFNGSPLISYCIELVQTFVLPSGVMSYTAVPVSSAPIGSTSIGMGPNKATDLSRLFGSYYTASLGSIINSAAMQLAIWEIVYETGQSYSLATGTFTASNGANADYTSARAQANQWLQNLGNVLAPLVALSNPDRQDFITVVPVPPSAALLGTGLLFGLWTMRRRRTNA